MKNPRLLIGIALAAAASLAFGTASAHEATLVQYRAAPPDRYAPPPMYDNQQGPRRGVDGVLPEVDQRQARQQQRIQRGLRSGDLAPQEARRLQRQQREIRRMERRAIADGVVTPREQYEINQAQNQASRSIRRQRQDPQRY